MTRRRVKKAKQILKSQLRKHYTVLVPWIQEGRTKWHPSELDRDGPIHHGTVRTKKEAEAWARTHLGGARFSIKSYRRPIG
jgi:hypothetical protein